MRTRCGYTLVEIMVVVAVIAVLAAILFPVVNNARAKGREAKCTSNLRAIHNALTLYAQDYGRYPDPQETSIVGVGWPISLLAAQGRLTISEVRCPADHFTQQNYTSNDSRFWRLDTYSTFYNYYGYYPQSSALCIANSAEMRSVYAGYTPALAENIWYPGGLNGPAGPGTDFPALINTHAPASTVVTFCTLHPDQEYRGGNVVMSMKDKTTGAIKKSIVKSWYRRYLVLLKDGSITPRRVDLYYPNPKEYEDFLDEEKALLEQKLREANECWILSRPFEPINKNRYR